MRLESSIRTKVKSKGLFPAKNPPQKIKVTTKK
ncbi:FtsL-like putative cell division protein [Tenacibaculum finnmarkense]|nr:FtsL-like putative cell division protein [Tenacibaculum finnmarkense]